MDPGSSCWIASTRVSHDTSTPCRLELGADERAELGVDGWEYFGELLDLGHGDAARDERLGHLEADVAGADDHRSSDVWLF